MRGQCVGDLTVSCLQLVCYIYSGCLPAGSRRTSGSHPQLFYHSDQSTDTLYSFLVRTEKMCSANLSHIWGRAAGPWLTVDVSLFLRAHDGHQMSSQHATVLLSNLPAQTLAEVSVAETLKLVPTGLASLQVWKQHKGQAGASAVWWLLSAGGQT